MNGFTAYAAYKSSGVEWFGEIPAHWDLRRLKFVAAINPSKSEITHLPGTLEVSFLPMERVGNGTLDLELTKSLKEIKQGFTYFRDGDVIVAKITPSFENGKGALASGLKNGIGFGTTELHVIRASKSIDRQFLYYLTLTHHFRGMGETQMYGTAGQKRVPDRFINDFPTPLPPISEQREITEFLDSEITFLDTLIAYKRGLIYLLNKQRTSVISHAVRKGLNSDTSMKPSDVEWLGDVPEHWEVRRLKSITKTVINGSWGDEPKDDSNDLFCIRVADFDYDNLGIFEDKLTLRNIERSQQLSRILSPNDLLIEKSGGGDIWPVGRVVNYTLDKKAVSSNFIARLIPVEQMDKRFLCYVFAAMYAIRLNNKSIKQTTGIQNLDLYSYLCELIGIPPLIEQKKIANYLDEEMQTIDLAIREIQESIRLLEMQRVALITAAVTGKIDVR